VVHRSHSHDLAVIPANPAQAEPGRDVVASVAAPDAGDMAARAAAASPTGAAQQAAPHGSAVSTLDTVQTFRNRATGNCLDSWMLEQEHVTWPCDGSDEQKWNVHVWGDGTRELKSMNSHECLDDSQSGLRMYECNGMTTRAGTSSASVTAPSR